MLMAPVPEQKISGCRLTSVMSACRVSGAVAAAPGGGEGRRTDEVGLLEERHGAFGPQHGEGLLALDQRPRPERHVGQVDVVDRRVRGAGHGRHPSDTGARTPSSPAVHPVTGNGAAVAGAEEALLRATRWSGAARDTPWRARS